MTKLTIFFPKIIDFTYTYYVFTIECILIDTIIKTERLRETKKIKQQNKGGVKP